MTYEQSVGAYISAVKVKNIYQRCTYKMAAKINWRRYGTKLRHCHPIYNGLYARPPPDTVGWASGRVSGL